MNPKHYSRKELLSDNLTMDLNKLDLTTINSLNRTFKKL